MAKAKVGPSLYEILEVSQRASPEVIEAAWKAIMKRNYSRGKFIDGTATVNNAHDILSDPSKRREYDLELNGRFSGKVLGNYRILELIAEGGFGKTYKGEHVVLKTPVCVKHCTYVGPQAETVMFEEAQAMWDLRHFGIPAIRDLLRAPGGSLALIMSYIPGPTLEQIVKKNSGKLDAEHVAWIAERSLNVLHYLHHHGVVHGDVKPQNIIVQPGSHNIVLVDYGLSAIRPSDTTVPKGFTPYFAAPEQERDKPILPESDFYSLGMTMLYGLGGDVENKKIPSGVPNAFKSFIECLIEDDIKRRPQWDDGDLIDKLRVVREESFGRRRSGMKPIPGI